MRLHTARPAATERERRPWPDHRPLRPVAAVAMHRRSVGLDPGRRRGVSPSAARPAERGRPRRSSQAANQPTCRPIDQAVSVASDHGHWREPWPRRPPRTASVRGPPAPIVVDVAVGASNGAVVRGRPFGRPSTIHVRARIIGHVDTWPVSVDGHGPEPASPMRRPGRGAVHLQRGRLRRARAASPRRNTATRLHPFPFGDGQRRRPERPRRHRVDLLRDLRQPRRLERCPRTMIDGTSPDRASTLDPPDRLHGSTSASTTTATTPRCTAGRRRPTWPARRSPVAIVDDNGLFLGWATFHVVERQPAAGQKAITGYFKTNIQNSMLSVHCPVGGCPQFFGSYEFKLIN